MRVLWRPCEPGSEHYFRWHVMIVVGFRLVVLEVRQLMGFVLYFRRLSCILLLQLSRLSMCHLASTAEEVNDIM